MNGTQVIMESVSQSLSCATCVYFVKQAATGGTLGAPQGGTCKRNPPVPYAVIGQDMAGRQAMQVMPLYPPVSLNEWCGEHATQEDLMDMDD